MPRCRVLCRALRSGLVRVLAFAAARAAAQAGDMRAAEALLLATAAGAEALRAFLERPGAPRGSERLGLRGAGGWTALDVAAYSGDALAMELLLDAGAEAQPHEVQAYLSAEDEVGVPLGSLVELIVRRSSMLIMLGTGFLPPAFLRSALRRTSTARAPRDGDPGVPDMARSLALVMGRGGARPTEKSQEEGSDLARAAYFLDADIVETLVRFQVEDALPLSAAAGRGMGRALVAAMIGVAQMKHRLNRALLQQPRMAGRLFRNYYGFDVPSEEALTHPDFVAMSFEDTVRIVQGKACDAGGLAKAGYGRETRYPTIAEQAVA